MKKLIALLLALVLPLCAAGEDAHRWVEDITKLTALPPADESRMDAGFVRVRVSDGADALRSALLWADSDALCLPGAERDAYSAFVMERDGLWHVTLCSGTETAVMQLDGEGRLLSLVQPARTEPPAWEGYLPRDTYTAIRSYLEHFALLNGWGSVTDYARVRCAWDGDGYDVLVTVRAKISGTPCEFTVSLATMGFTALSCPVPMPIAPTDAAPAGMEQFVVNLDGRLHVVEAFDKRSRGDAFSPWPQDALPRETVFSIGFSALDEAFGLSVADLTVQPFSYGYDAESETVIWQLDFFLRDTGEGYTVHVRDSDGAVMGVWAPEEANG